MFYPMLLLKSPVFTKRNHTCVPKLFFFYNLFELPLYTILLCRCSWFNDKSFSFQQEFWRWSINMTCPIHYSKFEYRAFHDRSIQRLSPVIYRSRIVVKLSRPYSYISVNASFQLQKIMHYFRSLPGLMAARRGEYTNMFFPSGLVSHPRRDQNPGARDLSGTEGCFPHPEKFPPLTQPHVLWGKYNKTHNMVFNKLIVDFSTS